MVFARFAFGLAALVCSALLVKTGMQRLIRGIATMFAAAVAFAVGFTFVGSTAFGAIRRRRARRRAG